MDWFPDILLALQSTSLTKMMYILPTEGMPHFLENPNKEENTSDIAQECNLHCMKNYK